MWWHGGVGLTERSEQKSLSAVATHDVFGWFDLMEERVSAEFTLAGLDGNARNAGLPKYLSALRAAKSVSGSGTPDSRIGNQAAHQDQRYNQPKSDKRCDCRITRVKPNVKSCNREQTCDENHKEPKRVTSAITKVALVACYEFRFVHCVKIMAERNR